MMTDPDRLLDLLADHDAGLPVDPAVLEDPRARRMLDALAATRAELAAVAPVALPPEISARWNAVLTATEQDVAARRTPDRPQPTDPQRPDSQPTGRVDGTLPLRPGDVSRHSPAAPPLLDRPAPDSGNAAAPVERAPRPPGRPDHRPPVSSNTEDGFASGGRPVAGQDPVAGDGRGRSRGPDPSGHRPAHGAVPGSPSAGRPTRPTDRHAPTPPGPRRPGVGRRRRPRPAVVAGLVLAVVLVVAGLVSTRPTPPAITAAQLGGIARASVGVQDAGALADPVRRASCLRSVDPLGPGPDAPLAGSRTVVFEGRPGVILLLITGELGVFRVVVVDPDCGAGGGTLLYEMRVGG